MRFNVLNWNIGGAKVLEQKTRQQRALTRKGINDALDSILKDHDNIGIPQPHVITLQEIVQFREPGLAKVELIDQDRFPDYQYHAFPLIGSRTLSSRAKWDLIKDQSDWHEETEFAQGNGFLIRKGAPLFPVWDLSNLDQPIPESDHLIELIHLDSGLYFGDRNTEPRAALVAHFRFDPDEPTHASGSLRKPLDIFVVNVHLTTLMMEREGVPEIDRSATRLRMAQLDVVLNGIVSRYNSWRRSGFLQRNKARLEKAHETFTRYSPIWILAGDFNFTEASSEYDYVTRMNFADTVPDAKNLGEWGRGTKSGGPGKPPTLTLDYVFAGPRFVALDSAVETTFTQNKVIRDVVVRGASDHLPLSSSITLIPQP